MGVRVRQRSDRPGWWVIIDHNKKRRKKHFPDKETALTVARKIRERLALGDFTIQEPEARFPFSTFYKEWLETYVKNHTKTATYASYELAYRAHLLPALGETDVREISREQLKRFLYEKLNAGLARNTIRGYLAPLREMFNHAIEDGHVNRNPCQGLMRNVRTEHGERQEKIHFYRREEVVLLLDSCKQHFPGHYPFILLLVRTGLRLGEAIALQWGDLDFHNRFIEVRRTFSPRDRRMNTPKSGKRRRVDMSRQLTETLKNLLVERKKETLKKVGKEYQNGSLLMKRETE